ncbi:MAG TPA: CPBP family intramembrane glutamic endopeptidase [Gemmatimonadaceae bacterium]|nr:CPBP family intramembrane glutamic endopeptidase [Gemmatimonadaceae bacterium]
MTARDFFAAPDRLLRLPWRLLVFALITLVAVIVAGAVGFALLPGGIRGAVQSGRRLEVLLLISLAMVIGFLIAHWVMLRWIDHQPWSYVGLGHRQASPISLGTGILLGALAIGVPSLLLVSLGWLHLRPARSGDWLAFALRVSVVLLPAALYEELMVRGYLFALLRDTWGWQGALVVTSIIFGLLHLGNPGAGPESIVAVMLAGFFLGGVLLVTGSLYASWMAHFAWNCVMAALLHTSVSGLPFRAPDYRIVDAGPDWITGGRWGPEGGAGAIVGMLVALIFLALRWRRRAEHTNAPALTSPMDEIHA